MPFLPAIQRLAVSSALALVLSTQPCVAETFYVATGGSNQTGDGSSENPWQTIAYAVNNGISGDGGHTILVRSGLYDGDVVVGRGFPAEVVIRAEEEHGAVLTNLANERTILAIYVDGSANIRFEGFVITGEGATGPVCSTRLNNMIHFENASDIVFHNNIVYGNNRFPFCNDIMKINRSGAPHFPRNIRIVGNVFYDHPQVFGNDIIDSVRPGELEISDNIFFSDLGVSEAQSFITLKRQVPDEEAPPDVGNPRYKIHRNVFLGFEGGTDQAFVQFGEDGVATLEITNALIENNLFIGNSTHPIAAPVQLLGVRGITVRANTVTGDLPGWAYGFRIGTTGANPTTADLSIHNNLWSDPTGTMGSTFALLFGSVDAESIVLDRNLYWNGGGPLPGSGIITPLDDAGRVVADPLLETDHSGIVLPKWDTVSRRFESGSSTIREEFERLVNTYGALAVGSPAIDGADPANAPADDILGRPRGADPDLGAYEYGAVDVSTRRSTMGGLKNRFRK